MQPDDSIEAKRSDFFKRARTDLDNGVDPIVWESEFADLWPMKDGGFDQRAAFEAFQRENLHWVWPSPDVESGESKA